MVGVVDLITEEYTAYVGDDEVPYGLMRLAEADFVAGHNFLGYDAPVIEKLSDGLIVFDRDRIEDTLILSRKLFPGRKSHSLESWGLDFGLPKLPSPLFERFTPELVPYCKRDVILNKRLYDHLIAEMISREAK
jgi:hypothetical protein